MKRNGVLKNMTELAGALGITTTFIKRMKHAGFEMPGGVSTEAWVLKGTEVLPQKRTRPRARTVSQTE